MTTIGVSEFAAKRHSNLSTGSATRLLSTYTALVSAVHSNWSKRVQGYTKGVLEIELNCEFSGVSCTSPTVQILPSDQLSACYEPRIEGELPRKGISVLRSSHPPAKFCTVILYSREKLEEGGEKTTGADWDVITILGSDVSGTPPMSPSTLMANHFGDSGGSATNMSPKAFEAALRESYNYWRGRANVKITQD